SVDEQAFASGNFNESSLSASPAQGGDVAPEEGVAIGPEDDAAAVPDQGGVGTDFGPLGHGELAGIRDLTIAPLQAAADPDRTSSAGASDFNARPGIQGDFGRGHHHLASLAPMA